MQRSLITVAIAAAFAFPLSAIAVGDKDHDKAADKKAESSAATQAKSDDGGAKAMFESLDKNKDHFLSKEEVKGTPHDKDFSKLDKNNDGKLSPEEHAAAPEHSSGKHASDSATSPTAKAKK